MRFRRDVNLDVSQISDRRGLSGGAALAGGGGIIGVLLVLALNFLGADPTAVSQLSQQLQTYQTQTATNTQLAESCKTGADANDKPECRIVGVVNSIQEYWTGALPQYRPAKTVFFTQATNSACGSATSSTGPFYCPIDETIYIDLGFYNDLRSSFGATGGPFAEAYVMAHEYGHHVQQIQGVLDRARQDRSGAESAAVRKELMADCYAGVWAHNAESTGIIEEITQADIRDGINAAEVIGDDRIQSQQGGSIDQDTWTHGSSAQRQQWFQTGYRSGHYQSCDTFRASRL